MWVCEHEGIILYPELRIHEELQLLTMSLDSSSCDFLSPFLIKITIFIPHLPVKAKGSDFSLSQVCCRRQGAEQGPCPLLHTCTHQGWALGARAGGKATNRKNCEIYGYLDLLLLLAILCLAWNANCICWRALICGCEECVGFPRPLSHKCAHFSSMQGGMLALSLPAGNRTLIPNKP